MEAISNISLNSYQPHFTKKSKEEEGVEDISKKSGMKKSTKAFLGMTALAAATLACVAMYKQSPKGILSRNKEAANFIKSAKEQGAEIVSDIVKKREGHNDYIRVIATREASGKEVTCAYYPLANAKPFVRITKTEDAIRCERNIGDPLRESSITKYNDGSGKINGYCAFNDAEGEYLQLTPQDGGWLIVRRSSKPNESLPINLSELDVKDFDSAAPTKGFDYLFTKKYSDKEDLPLSKVIDSEVGYPYGINPFSI